MFKFQLKRLFGNLPGTRERGSRTAGVRWSAGSFRNSQSDCILQENERDRPWRTRSNALDVATLSPQRAKRILANREAAHRSRVKKLKYTKELETEVARLERDNETVLQTLSGAQDHYRGKKSCSQSWLGLRI